jgi:hypothetical protein
LTIVKAHELFKPECEATDKRRLAVATARANEFWQADEQLCPQASCCSAYSSEGNETIEEIA